LESANGGITLSSPSELEGVTVGGGEDARRNGQDTSTEATGPPRRRPPAHPRRRAPCARGVSGRVRDRRRSHEGQPCAAAREADTAARRDARPADARGRRPRLPRPDQEALSGDQGDRALGLRRPGADRQRAEARRERGMSNAAIAKQLWVAQQTVKFHLTNIYRKLGVANRTEAARYAYQQGLIESPLHEDEGSPLK